MSVFNTTIHFLLDLVFPQTCVGCGQSDSLLCPVCQASLQAKPQLVDTPGICKTIIATDYQLPVVQQAIKQFKYHNLPQLAKPLAQLLISALDEEPTLSPFIIAPIPLHTKRQRQRGYNQSELLANIVSQHFGWTVMTDLHRVINTEHQAGLNRQQRLKNLDNAFEYRGPSLKGKHILLIDDVVTTGTTMQSVAEALLAVQPASISALAIARNREKDK